MCDGVPIRCTNAVNESEADAAGEVQVGDGGGSGSSGSASAGALAGLGGVLGMRGVPSVPPRIENAAVSGEWHHRMETNQWPGYSTLWYSC